MGSLIVSIDVELIWGFNHLLFEPSYREYIEELKKIMTQRSRKNMKELVRISEKHKIPFTWAIVGHLALHACSRVDGIPHPDMPRPEGFKLGDWYAYDPCSNYRDDPLWYAPDIIETIIGSSLEQDIGCHSFSHINFREASRETARAEVRKCREVLHEYGVKPVSFVYPRNIVAHLDVLREEGFKTYRYKLKRVLPVKRKIAYKLADVISPLLGRHKMQNGLVGIPGTFLYQTPRRWEVPLLVAAAKRGIKKVSQSDGIFHIHFHDYLESDELLRGLDSVLGYAARLRDKGKIEVYTMAEYAEAVLDG